MIGFMAVRHVWNRADELGMARPTYQQIRKAANKARALRVPFPVKVGFSSCLNPFSDRLISMMNPTCTKINFNYEWLARAVLFGDKQDFQTAFKAVIGHEVGHKVATCPLKHVLLPQCRKFVRWINEYYADFYAVTMALGGSRELMIASMDYRRSIDKPDEDTDYMPSWKRRKEVMRQYIFDPTFVLAVAQDTGCTNYAVIQRVCNYYFGQQRLS